MDHILQCHEENGGYKKHILEMFQRLPIQFDPSFENMSYSDSTFCCLILAIILVAPPHTAEGQREITFTTNINTYASELNAFRQAVRTTNKRFDYFLLPLRTAVSGTNRYREINLRNSRGVAVKLAIDVVNVYVLAYHTSNPSCRGSYFFNDADARAAMSFVFRNSGEQKVLPFDGSYGDLAKNGGSRRNTTLGLPLLSDLIPALYDCRRPADTYERVATALLLAIQTISEGARFKVVQDAVRRNSRPSEQVKDFQNKWQTISNAIQEANITSGNFKNSTTLLNNQGVEVSVGNVDHNLVRGNVKLLLTMQPRSYAAM